MTQGRKTPDACWIDLYDQPNFQGRLHRHFGPTVLEKFTAASVVVGPDASVQFIGRRVSKSDQSPVVLHLRPRVIIGDVSAWAKGIKIRSAKIERGQGPR